MLQKFGAGKKQKYWLIICICLLPDLNMGMTLADFHSWETVAEFVDFLNIAVIYRSECHFTSVSEILSAPVYRNPNICYKVINSILERAHKLLHAENEGVMLPSIEKTDLN
uniref:Uncharacterized protein n=1 Tax=Rhipicephalus microplus TaxID=6941 RepID=A0A6G5A5A0_RHIMP